MISPGKKDTDREIKGVVASRTASRRSRLYQCLSYPEDSPAAGILVTYTACLKIKHEHKDVKMRNTYWQICSSPTLFFIHSL